MTARRLTGKVRFVVEKMREGYELRSYHGLVRSHISLALGESFIRVSPVTYNALMKRRIVQPAGKTDEKPRRMRWTLTEPYRRNVHADNGGMGHYP